MDLEGIMLNEISQREKDKYCMISLTCGILKRKKNQAHRFKRTDWQVPEAGEEMGQENGGRQFLKPIQTVR